MWKDLWKCNSEFFLFWLLTRWPCHRKRGWKRLFLDVNNRKVIRHRVATWLRVRSWSYTVLLLKTSGSAVFVVYICCTALAWQLFKCRMHRDFLNVSASHPDRPKTAFFFLFFRAEGWIPGYIFNRCTSKSISLLSVMLLLTDSITLRRWFTNAEGRRDMQWQAEDRVSQACVHPVLPGRDHATLASLGVINFSISQYQSANVGIRSSCQCFKPR